MSGYLEGVLVLLAINIVLAYAAYLPMAAGQLNLGVAAFAAIGGYASAYLSNNTGMPATLAIALGGLVAGAIALVVAVPVLRTRGIYLALATFALGQIVQATILNLEVLGGAAGYPVTAYTGLPTVAAFALAVILLVSLLFATRFGIALTAVHDDERVADLMGLDVRAFQVAAFTLGSVIAGVAGGLYAHHFDYIEAQHFNISLGITAVLYVLFGGTQSVLGPLVGAAAFTFLPEALRASAQWRYVIFAAVIIVVVALRPQGLVSGGLTRRLLGSAGRGGSRPRERPRHHPGARQCEQAVRRAARHRRSQLRGAARGLHRADRPERRRQEHRLQPDHRRLSARRRPHPARRHRYFPRAVAPAHPPRRRAQLPEYPADAAFDGARERFDWPALPQCRPARCAAAGQPHPRQPVARAGRAPRSPTPGSAPTSVRASTTFLTACRSASSWCAP